MLFKATTGVMFVGLDSKKCNILIYTDLRQVYYTSGALILRAIIAM